MYPTDPWGLLGLWTALLLMLMIYSYPMYKENVFYRFAEHLFIGTGLAIAVITAIQTTNKIAITPLGHGKLIYIVPILLGFAMYLLLHPDYRWVSRYPMAMLVGSAIGLGMRGVLIPFILTQVIDTITPPVGGNAMAWFNFVFIAIGTFCSVMYFLLTIEHKGAIKYPTRLGRWFIMLGLGAYFGNTILFRMSMLAGRAQFFLQVLKIIPM